MSDHGQDPAPIPEPERSLSARLDTALHTLLGNGYNSLPVKWAVIRGVDDASPWAGVYGIDLNDKTSVAILIGMLVERGWIVDSWSSRNMTIFRIEDGVERRGNPSEAVVAAFEADVEKSL